MPRRRDDSPAARLDASAAVETVLEMIAIPGPSGEETAIADYIVERLRRAGVPPDAIHSDQAHRKSPHGGERGNLIVRLPGTLRGPRRLLMGHLDTVPLCVGSHPVRRGDVIRSADPTTALGGDNRAGAAVLLLAALTLLRERLPHPPLTLFWPVQEEVGLVGARQVALSKLGRPQLCFNFDGGDPYTAVIGATGADHLDIEVEGLASHAGAHPEEGISAAVIAGKAIQRLAEEGWHGLVEHGSSTGTSNIGALHGGAATNVVLNRLTLTAECRSHDPKFRARIVDAYRRAFEQAAQETRNVAGQAGRVRLDVHHKYESFRLQESEPCVQAALAAIRRLGGEPQLRTVNGGLDANWLTRHGYPTVTLGCGQGGIHTVEESLDVPGFLTACRIGLLLATAGEGA